MMFLFINACGVASLIFIISCLHFGLLDSEHKRFECLRGISFPYKNIFFFPTRVASLPASVFDQTTGGHSVCYIWCVLPQHVYVVTMVWTLIHQTSRCILQEYNFSCGFHEAINIFFPSVACHGGLFGVILNVTNNLIVYIPP